MCEPTGPTTIRTALLAPLLLTALAAFPALAQEEGQLGEIVVTATRTRVRTEDTGVSISVLNRDQVEHSEEPLVSQSLFGAPGTDVLEFGSPGDSAFISIRGAAPDQVVVLIDGVEVNTPTVGQFDLADFTNDNVNRIEVLRSSGGTLHGSGAIGGVVNILSERGEGPFRVNANVAAGSAWTNQEQLEVVGASGPFSLRGSTSYYGSQGFLPKNDAYRNTTTAWRADFDVLPHATARAFVRYNSAKKGLANFNVADGVIDSDARRRQDFLLLKGEWEHLVADNLSYLLSMSFVRDNPRYRDDGFSPEDPKEFESPLVLVHIPSEIVGANAQANYTVGDWSVTSIGVDFKERSARAFRKFYEKEIEDDGEIEYEREIENFRANRSNIGAFAQEQIQLFDSHLHAVGGVRYDKYDGFGDRFTGSASAAYRLPVLGTRLRAGFAQGFRAPTFDELYELAGNPNLKSETSWEVTAGVTQEFWGGRARLEPTYFHRKVHNLIEEVVDQLPGPIAPPAEEDEENLLARNLDATFDGAEILGMVQPWKWMWLSANYTYLDYKTPTAELLNRPRHRGSATLGFTHTGLRRNDDRCSAAVQVFGVGRRDSANPADDFEVEKLAGYVRTDLHLAYNPGGTWSAFSVSAGVRNLFDKDYQQSIGFPAPPATFLIGFHYRG